jgi:hypothetical protein
VGYHLVDLVTRSALPRRLYHIAAILASYADDATGARIWPSIKTVATRAGVSERTAQQAISELRRLGVLVVVQKHGPHRPTHYAFRPSFLPQFGQQFIRFPHEGASPAERICDFHSFHSHTQEVLRRRNQKKPAPDPIRIRSGMTYLRARARGR